MTYETKVSGEKKAFASGMVRDVDDTKLDYSLALDGSMFKRWVELLNRGKKNYGARNWMKAAGDEEYKRFRESAVRHFFQWYFGETDEDHAAAVFFNINGAEYTKVNFSEGKEFIAAAGVDKGLLGDTDVGFFIYTVYPWPASWADVKAGNVYQHKTLGTFRAVQGPDTRKHRVKAFRNGGFEIKSNRLDGVPGDYTICASSMYLVKEESINE